MIRKFEQVSFFSDPELDLTAIVAIHNTKLGPGLGGCRLRNYQSVDHALEDVLRLAEGMTFKSSLAGLNLGGAKSVIIASEKALANREKLFLQLGKWVHSLNGKYIAAEDMGTSVDDVKIMANVTPYLSGTDPQKGGGGDPSPFTAKGVMLGIMACLERVYGSASCKDKKVLIQGLGHVGLELGKLLAKDGAKLIVAETNLNNLTKAKDLFNFEICEPDNVYQTECDVFSPCAVGAILNNETIPLLKCKIVAGAANNQLKTLADEATLYERGIIYAPDFAINSGGVIMCAGEFEKGGYSKVWVDNLVGKIGETIGSILDESKRTGKSAGEVALDIAKARIDAKT